MGTHLSSQRELSNEHQHDKVLMVLNLCVLVLWMKVASASDGLKVMLVMGTIQKYGVQYLFEEDSNIISILPNEKMASYFYPYPQSHVNFRLDGLKAYPNINS